MIRCEKRHPLKFISKKVQTPYPEGCVAIVKLMKRG